MLSLCASADNVLSLFRVESKERLERELAIRDAIIDTLRKQVGGTTEPAACSSTDDKNVAQDTAPADRDTPRARSCSDLAMLNVMDSLYSSSSVWDLSRALSGSGTGGGAELEYTYSQILDGSSDGSLNLDNDGCLLVYACPKDLVQYLRPEFVEEQRRRWLLRPDFILALNN